MDFTAAHLGYVYASYALSAVCLLGLVLSVLGRDRALRREAASLDAGTRKEKP
jgi:heme exporter protein CcmD